MADKEQDRTITLFEKTGEENTSATFEAMASRIEKLGLDHLVIATTSGDTGVHATEFFNNYDIDIAIVAHQYGFRNDGEIELKDKNREMIKNSKKAELVITPDILTRVPKISRGKYGGSTYLDNIADTLRLFIEGMKVCIECTIQAADSGSIPVNEEVAAIAGTGSGADTGIILQSKHTHKLFDIDIREIVCMPRKR